MRAPLLPMEELDRLRADPQYWRSPGGATGGPRGAASGFAGADARLADGNPDDRVAASVTAYLVRMCTRATPFGLFAGCALGSVGEIDRIGGRRSGGHHAAQQTRHRGARGARRAAARRPVDAAGDGRSSPTPAATTPAGAMRLIESRLRDGRRTHHLVVIEDDAPLRCALDAAAGGCSVEKVVDAVAAARRRRARRGTRIRGCAGRGPRADPGGRARGDGPRAVGARAVVAERAGPGRDVGGAGAGVRGARRAWTRPGSAIRQRPTISVATSLLDLAGGGDDARLIQVDLHRAGAGLTLGPRRRAAARRGGGSAAPAVPSGDDPALTPVQGGVRRPATRTARSR